MNSQPPPPERPVNVAGSSADRIRDAALSLFATQGTAGTSLRAVATAAGVSLGRVQHHFGTKARLIKAVDDYVLSVLQADLPGPTAPPSVDAISKHGSRVVTLVADHPGVMEYLVRALVEGNEFGSVVFDHLVTGGKTRWENLKREQIARPDLDVTWAAINPIILTLGGILLRPHIERHLPEPLTTTRELHRWEEAVSSLLYEGQLRRTGNQQPPD